MILVVGATGTLGSRVVRRLRERQLPVRVLTRDPARAAGLAGCGVEVVQGDLREPESVRRAARGAETIIAAAHGFAGTNGSSPAAVDRVGNHQLVDAAVAERADVILLSIVGASPDSPLELFRAKSDAEAYLRRSGVAATIVRATAFIETWIDVLDAPRRTSGRGIVLGRGQNPINFVSADAVAALVVRAVIDPTLRAQTLEIGGPTNCTMMEFAALLTARAGSTREARHVPRAVLRAMSVVLRAIRPALAAQAAAAVVMDTRDMTFDASPLRAHFPDLPDIRVRDAIGLRMATT